MNLSVPVPRHSFLCSIICSMLAIFSTGWFEADWWNLEKMKNREGYQWLYREQRGKKTVEKQEKDGAEKGGGASAAESGGSEDKEDKMIEGFLCSDEIMQKAVSGSLKITNAFYAELDSEVDVPKNEKVRMACLILFMGYRDCPMSGLVANFN